MEAVKEEETNTTKTGGEEDGDNDEEEEESGDNDEEESGDNDEEESGDDEGVQEDADADEQEQVAGRVEGDDRRMAAPDSVSETDGNLGQHAALSGATADLSGISDEPQRQLSRSPPRSRSASPSLEEMTHGLSLDGIKNIVSSDLTKVRARQHRKYHSKRGARNVGRPQGSKAKQDTRVKPDQSGVWE
jgi:RIO kinase 2